MKVTIAGHTLTPTQVETLNAIQDHCRANPSVKYVREIFPARNNADNARRRTTRRLAELGVLKACGIGLEDALS